MSNWIVTTESGRVYRRVRGGVQVEGVDYYRNPMIRFLAWDEDTNPHEVAWATASEGEPEIGHRVYLSTVGAGWRLSTPIARVEWDDDVFQG